MQKICYTENSTLYNAKAVFYPQLDGSLLLARVHVFSTPRFKQSGWETAVQKPVEKQPAQPEEEATDKTLTATDRAIRRARRRAFDIIMSNPDLDCFGTFTYAPDSVADKGSYEDCYPFLRAWLSNGVQRDGLKYLCVPELTKRGDVHFHALCNSTALRMEKARNPNNGRLIKHNGDQVYNITNWRAGFSTAQIIQQRADADDPRLAVSKYIFKYMGKNFGAKIGGRYVLAGGELKQPIFAYGDGVEQFATSAAVDSFEMDLGENGKYWEYSFL